MYHVTTRALDQGGVEPRLAVSVRPEGHRQYHYTTAPAKRRGMDVHELRTSKPFISPNFKDNDKPRKVNLTPLSMNNSGTLRKENLVCPHTGFHRTCLTINGIKHRRERLLTPSHQGVDGAVACRPRSIS